MSGNLELEHELNIHQLANDTNHALSAWLDKQLESVASSISELQSAQHDPENLSSVQEELRKRRNSLAIPLKINPITEEDLYQYDSVEPELDGLIKSLKASTPEAATSRKNTRTLLSWKLPYTLLRLHTTPAATERARHQFGRTTEILESLKGALQLVSAFQKVYLAETRSLRREVKSKEEKIAYYETVHDSSSRTSSEEAHSIGSREKLALAITVGDVSRRTYPQIAQRNPFRDCSSSNRARHDHYRKEWLKDTCSWLINSYVFCDQWLFGNRTMPQIFYCRGPPGVGKSVIMSHVIETLNDIGNVHAYYYLGRGYVQSAEGLVLGLLGQLCDIKYVPSAGPDDTIHYHIVNTTGPPGVNEVSTPPLVEVTLNSTPSMNPNDLPCYKPEARATTKSSPTDRGEFGDNDSNPTDPTADSALPQGKMTDSRKGSLGESHDLLSMLLRALSDVCSKIPSPIFVAIDAWDEDNMEHPDDFLSIIRVLLSSNCKVFLTGREHNSVLLPWPCTQLEIQHQRTSGDVREYVKRILGNCRELQDYSNSRSYITPDLADVIAHLSGGSFHFAYTYATGRNRALERVLNRRVQNREAFGLRKWAFPSISLREATAQILSAIDVLEPEEFVQSLILLCLLNFPVPVSTTALGEALPIISKLFPMVYNPQIPYHDFSTVSKPIWPLISIDPGTQLIHLSSQVVIEELRDIWYEEWARRYSELLPRNFARILTVFCLQYMLDWSPKSVDFKKGYSMERLLDESPSLVFVVTSWNSHYRSFLQFITQLPMSSLTTIGPLPQLASELSTELGSNQHGGAYKDSSDGVGESNSSAECMFEATQRSEEQRESVINEDDRDITRLIAQLIINHELLQALVLLPIYLSKDPSAAMVPWDEALSWVSSMSHLHILSKLGLVNIARKLEFKISPSDAIAKDKWGMTALHIAAQRGLKEDVCTLLEAEAKPHLLDRSLKTAMDYAAAGRHDGVLACLFENFCEVWSDPNSCLLTIRNLAKSYGQYLKAGRKTDTPDLSVALIHAINRTKVGLVCCLLNYGADPDSWDENGVPVLHHALRKASSKESSDDTHNVIRILLHQSRANPFITSKNDSAESALHVAVRSGSRTATLMLVALGVDMRSGDAEGRSALMVLIETASEETYADYMVQRLHYSGADIEQADKKGRRALHIAAQRGFPIVVQALVFLLGANAEPRDNEGKTPLDYARENNRGETIQMLEKLLRMV
ncbi:hypothetical protein GGR51DRAFT_404200 [Nemania sp. FL0031]|nr:hypothetical protein GGR51DRAFT_404200 [Nemania sp. FL0031]